MLISEWGKREVLFDSKNPFYFNKDARATALNRMIEELKFSGLLARKFIMKFIYNYRFILWRRLSQDKKKLVLYSVISIKITLKMKISQTIPTFFRQYININKTRNCKKGQGKYLYTSKTEHDL